MPTAASWAEPAFADPPPSLSSRVRARVEHWRQAASDVRHLLRFRAATVRRPRTLVLTGAALVLITVSLATLPALTGAAELRTPAVLDALDLLPAALAGFLIATTAAAAATGGGRELLTRDQAALHPLSGTVDHLGALLLAPLNLVWLIQAWVLLSAVAFAVPPGRLIAAQVGVGLWLLVATAIGQLVAWTAESIRRTRHGVLAVRLVLVGLVGLVTVVHFTRWPTGLVDLLVDVTRTRWLIAGLVDGIGWSWALRVTVEVVLLIAFVALGAGPARVAVRRTPREELRVDSGQYAARKPAVSDLGAAVRIDRASVWRAVPVRRGVAVLIVGPTVAALIGHLTWSQLTILPGLVASGAALLFGVNTWCLDGRGSLWRESLPVSPATVFDSRAIVLAEFLLVASGAALVPAVRAGAPTLAQVVALVGIWLVVVVQVLASSMRWSGLNPAAVELRSARDTPAPPMSMVGYSAKLVIGASLSSVFFAALSRQADAVWPLLATVPFLLWSGAKLWRARNAWVDPVGRARVTAVVAG